MAESGIETTVAPDWLLKLESRREQIKAKLGHESGNGALCIVCENKCPGLDLHFWRKVCRNCKCRKEQHDCKDDDVTGWAQFEILGAIRSKPAYIKISELADKPVQLDWIPPNVTPELASDYMYKLGEHNIPIAGSEAAEKRKQQLEYQVPPHDLDASLCHNLSENEAAQLVQYVEKIRKNCVGQGNVIRVGDNINYLQKSKIHIAASVAETFSKETLVKRLLNSKHTQAALSEKIVSTNQPLCLENKKMKADFINSSLLSDKTKYKLKLMQVNSEAIQSVVQNGPELDSMFNSLNARGLQYHDDCLLGPLDRLRHEYLRNSKFQAEIDKFVAESFDTPVPKEMIEGPFNSPVPLKKFSRHDAPQYQETVPVRNMSFDEKPPQSAILSRECQAALKKDSVLATILNSELLKSTLHVPVYGGTLIITRNPLFPDFISSPFLSPTSKARLETMRINTQTIQSAVINGPLYDELLSQLNRCGINYAQDSILQPIDDFRDEFLSYDSDNDFQKEIIDFIKNSDLSSFGLAPAQIPESVEIKKHAQSSNQLLAEILSTPVVEDALNAKLQPGSVLKIHNDPMVNNLQKSKLPVVIKNKMNDIKIDSQAVESAVVCGPIYDKLFDRLKRNGINYATDSILGPIANFRYEYLNDHMFRKEMTRYVVHPATCLFNSAIIQELQPKDECIVEQLSGMHISHSEDSGFGSIPPTPNYATYPGMLNSVNASELTAPEGAFASIPAIEDMNMYPEISQSRNAIPTVAGTNPFAQYSYENFDQLPQPPHDEVACSGCKQNIKFGEVAVKADRAGSSAAWHPNCFKCYKCDELLADLVYFYHGGHVYCARDLADILKIPRCSACDELIFTKEYTAAEGSTFHIKHFCCYQCDAPLAGQQYVPDEKSNMPLCLTCYETYFAKSCHSCRGIIGPAEQGVAWGDIHWHGACFLCSGKGCGKSLIGGRFCVKNEMPFCSSQCLRSIVT